MELKQEIRIKINTTHNRLKDARRLVTKAIKDGDSFGLDIQRGRVKDLEEQLCRLRMNIINIEENEKLQDQARVRAEKARLEKKRLRQRAEIEKSAKHPVHGPRPIIVRLVR
jgi:hypothetical protein